MVRRGAWPCAALLWTATAAWAEGPPPDAAPRARTSTRGSTVTSTAVVATASVAALRPRPPPAEPPELTRLREAELELLGRVEGALEQRTDQLRTRQAELLVRREDVRDGLRRRASAGPLAPLRRTWRTTPLVSGCAPPARRWPRRSTRWRSHPRPPPPSTR